MERLTFNGNFCDIAICQEERGGEHCPDGYCPQRRVWERLKAYEDMGLPPVDLESFRASFGRRGAIFRLTKPLRKWQS